MVKKSENYYDLASWLILLFITIFSLVRFPYLPQFIDGYYHLSVANGFLGSGGWVGWTWWDFAPLGRPHLYPPGYHLLLCAFIKLGVSGLNAIRFTEVIIVPVFFYTIWSVSKRLINQRFSFFFLLILSSFFPFYTSISANLPASISLVLGFISWYFFYRSRILASSFCLILAFYTHAAIPWTFLIAFIFIIIFSKEYRVRAIKVSILSFILSVPYFYHEYRYLEYLNIKLLKEANFTIFSIFIVFTAVVSLFLNMRIKKKQPFYFILFLGFFLGNIIFFIKYPYRFFSAQGMVAGALLSALLIEKAFDFFKGKFLVLFRLVIILFLFFAHSTLNLEEGKPKLKIFNSTCYNFLTGNIYSVFSFRSLFFPQFYQPIVEVIEKNSYQDDILASNFNVVSQIFSALTKRPSLNSMLWEVKPKENKLSYQDAKIVVLLKDIEKNSFKPNRQGWHKVYENDLAYVFVNDNYQNVLPHKKASIPFVYILVGFFILCLLYIRISVEERLNGNRSICNCSF